jgi:hypothetical protein
MGKIIASPLEEVAKVWMLGYPGIETPFGVVEQVNPLQVSYLVAPYCIGFFKGPVWIWRLGLIFGYLVIAP